MQHCLMNITSGSYKRKKAKVKKIPGNHTLIGHIKEEYALEHPPKDLVKMLVDT